MTTDVDIPSFAHDIQPLFRDDDRFAMNFVFDLWDYQDVCTHAENILERIEDGSMPCDIAWSEEQIDLLRRWIATGMAA